MKPDMVTVTIKDGTGNRTDEVASSLGLALFYAAARHQHLADEPATWHLLTALVAALEFPEETAAVNDWCGSDEEQQKFLKLKRSVLAAHEEFVADIDRDIN